MKKHIPTSEEIVANNKIFALFMGMIPVKTWTAYCERFHLECEVVKYSNGLSTDDLEYHKSWDWLMTVYEAINHRANETWRCMTIGHGCSFVDNTKFKMDEQFYHCTGDLKQDVYDSCLEAVDYLNNPDNYKF